MRDITGLMDHYRSVARSIWNAGFWTQEELRNWDSIDRFRKIRNLLFDALVVARLDEEGACCKDLSTAPVPVLQVVPLDSGPIPILIHRPREGDRNYYWDDPVREIKAAEAKLRFLDYFDWNEMDNIDFQYYKVRIELFTPHPDLVGREALLEHQYAKVFVTDAPTRPVATE
jgi:hypothetical protein